MEGEAIRSEVLFATRQPMSWDQLGEVLRKVFPKTNGAPEIGLLSEDAALFDFGMVRVGAEFRAELSQTPGATAAHAAHVAVISDEGLEPRDAAWAVTLVSAALARRKDCAGVLWNSVPLLIPPEAFRRGAARMEQGQDPFPLWVALATERDLHSLSGSPRPLLRTLGLSVFFGREIEADAGEGPEQEADRRKAVSGLLAQMFRSWVAPEDGSACASAAGEVLRVQAEQFGIASRGPVWHLLPEPAGPTPVPEPMAAPVPEDGPEPVLESPPAPAPSIPASARATAGPGPAATDPAPGRQTSVLLFAPNAPPEPAVLAAVIERHARRVGASPTLTADTPDRIEVNWGVMRMMGDQRTTVRHSGWSLPPDLFDQVMREAPELLAADPDLLMRAAPVLVSSAPSPDLPEEDAGRHAVMAATLVAHVSAAMMTLPGARAVVWPASRVVMQREAAIAAFRGMGSGLPIRLCVAQRRLEGPRGEPVFLTRGFAALREPEVMMRFGALDRPRLATVFDALVRGVFLRSLSRRGDRSVNAIDGAEFRLQEERLPDGSRSLLIADLAKDPRGPGVLPRLFGRRG